MAQRICCALGRVILSEVEDGAGVWEREKRRGEEDGKELVVEESGICRDWAYH